MKENCNQVDKAKLITRLKRIEGQVRGIQKMIESESSCSDILIQIAAVKAAVNKVGTIVFEHHANECFTKQLEKDEKDPKEIEELMKILSSFIK